LKKKQSAKQKSAKKKQISIKTSPKTSSPQVFKKTRNFTKKQAQIAGYRKVGNTALQRSVHCRTHDRFHRNGEMEKLVMHNVQCSSQRCEKNIFRV